MTGARSDPAGVAGFGLVVMRSPARAHRAAVSWSDLVPVTTRAARNWEAGAMLKYVDAYMRWEQSRAGAAATTTAGAAPPSAAARATVPART